MRRRLTANIGGGIKIHLQTKQICLYYSSKFLFMQRPQRRVARGYAPISRGFRRNEDLIDRGNELPSCSMTGAEESNPPHNEFRPDCSLARKPATAKLHSVKERGRPRIKRLVVSAGRNAESEAALVALGSGTLTLQSGRSRYCECVDSDKATWGKCSADHEAQGCC